MVLPNPSLGATVFQPLVTFTFFFLGHFTCGEMEDKINQLKRWDGDGVDNAHEQNGNEEILADGDGTELVQPRDNGVVETLKLCPPS